VGVTAISNEMSRLLAVKATLLIFFPGAFVTTPSAQELLVLIGQILQPIGKHNYHLSRIFIRICIR